MCTYGWGGARQQWMMGKGRAGWVSVLFYGWGDARLAKQPVRRRGRESESEEIGTGGGRGSVQRVQWEREGEAP